MRMDSPIFAASKNYIAMLERLKGHEQRIQFLISCLRNKILPALLDGVRVPMGFLREKRIRENLWRFRFVCLKVKIRNTWNDLQCLRKDLDICKQYLSEVLGKEEFSSAMDIALDAGQTAKRTSKDRMKAKYAALCESKVDPSRPRSQVLLTDRMTCIPDGMLNRDERMVLSRGLSFAPTHALRKEDVFQLQVDVARLAYQLRVKAVRDGERLVAAEANAPPSCEPECVSRSRPRFDFERNVFAVPRADDHTERKLLMLREGIENLTDRYMDYRSKPNLPLSERRALRSLKEKVQKKEMRITVSDKGGDLVAMESSVESAMMGTLLGHTDTYTMATRKELNAALRKVISARELKGMSSFTHGPLRTPVMYGLVKTHKMPIGPITPQAASLLKCRPIISAVNGPAYRVSRFLASAIGPLLRRTRACDCKLI